MTEPDSGSDPGIIPILAAMKTTVVLHQLLVPTANKKEKKTDMSARISEHFRSLKVEKGEFFY